MPRHVSASHNDRSAIVAALLGRLLGFLSSAGLVQLEGEDARAQHGDQLAAGVVLDPVEIGGRTSIVPAMVSFMGAAKAKDHQPRVRWPMNARLGGQSLYRSMA